MDDSNGGASGAAIAPAASEPEIPHDAADDLTWMPAWKIRDLIVSRQITAIKVTEHFLERIARLDPTLNAFREVDADGARAQARAADEAVRRGDRLGSLHGVPIAIKEEIKVRGLIYPPIGVPSRDDDIMVERLRNEGVVVLGTTVMPGMGCWAGQKVAYGTEPPADLQAHPRNPWDITRVPGASSAGSAAAAVARLVPIALGGDGGGSTRLPSALCGVMGVHPARGRIPRVDYGQRSFELTNTDGPITRDPRDAAIVMQAVAGPDGRDFISAQEPIDYLADLTRGVDGLSFAWTEDYGLGELFARWRSQPVVDGVHQAASRFTEIGAPVTPTEIVLEDFWAAYNLTSLHFRSGTGARLYVGYEADAERVRDALELRRRMEAQLLKVFETHDLLLSPTIDFVAPTLEAWDAAWTSDGAEWPHGFFAPVYTHNTHFYNWLGWPAVSVPCGFVDGLPIGLQISAPPWREAQIFRAAHAFMQAFPRNERPPVS